MLCENCKKRNATVHFTEIVNDKVTELHLCQDCAKDKGFGQSAVQPNFSLAELLAGLINQEGREKKDVKKKTDESHCPRCGMTFTQFKKAGKIGCGECYTVFKKNLHPIIKKIHSHVQHIGKAPVPVVGKLKARQKISDLKQQLDEAVKNENYEYAAKIRDDIKTLEQAGKGEPDTK